MGFSDEDLGELFGAIGGEIQVELEGISLPPIIGRIKKEYLETDGGFSVSAGVLVPILTAKGSDLVGITKRHVLTYKGTRYQVARDPHPSDAGFCRVQLQAAK